MNPTELNAFIHTKLGRQGESLDYCGNRDAAFEVLKTVFNDDCTLDATKPLPLKNEAVIWVGKDKYKARAATIEEAVSRTMAIAFIANPDLTKPREPELVQPSLF